MDKLDKQFNITSVCRQDIVNANLMTQPDARKITDNEMDCIADKMADAFCETDGYWLSLEEAVNYIKED